MVGGWCAAKMAALHAVATERDPPGGGGARHLAEPRMAMERRPYRGEGGPSWRFSGLRGSAGFGILSALPAKGARVSETAVKFQRLRA